MQKNHWSFGHSSIRPAQNPDVKIKPTIFAWNQIGLAFMKAGLAGKVPDVTMLNSGRVQRVVAANFLRPLDPYLEKSGHRSDYILMPNAIRADKKIYGVPYEVRALGFLYRSDLLNKAGLAPPKNLSELTQSAKKMQELEGPNFIGVGIGFDPKQDSAEKFFIPAVAALGGKLLNDDGSANFVTPQAIKVMNYLPRPDPHLGRGGARRLLFPGIALASYPADQGAEGGHARLHAGALA